MAHIFKPRFGGGADLNRCRSAVHDSSGVGFHQCTRKPVIDRDGVGFCAQHDPVRVQEKADARYGSLRAQWAERDRAAEYKKALQAFRCAAVEALRLIADGHNDARGVALEALSKEPKPVSSV